MGAGTRRLWEVAAGVLLFVMVIGGLVFVKNAIGASARIEALEDQRDGLQTANQSLQAALRVERERTDDIGASLDSLAALSASTVQEMSDTVEVMVERIVEIVPPEVAILVEKADSIRVEQVAEVTRRAERAEATVDSLRVAINRERLLWAQTETNYVDQISILEDQLETAMSALPGNFLQEIADDPLVLVVGAVIGGAACYQWCPRDGETVVVQAPLLSIGTPF